ncbi:GPI inositol-deacylase [Monosporozyma servazzii]
MLFGKLLSGTFRSVLARTRRLSRRKRSYDQEDSETEKTLQTRSHYGKTFKYTSYMGISFIILLCAVSKFLQFSGPDSQQCRPIWMYPSYARIDGFDTRFTPLAHKYHLYLYREQGKDKEPLNGNEIQLDGVPVLFIPGNAGSFKQSRSIAAEAANIYFESKDILDNQVNTRNLDFFTADFNEDFTAFHGQTMLDQAEYLNDAISYIISLYEESNTYDMPLPESVIIVAHSMGGIVTRLMMTLENHIPGSINTILTLSSPHAASPVTFDGDILKIYKKIDRYWTSQFDDDDSFFSKNVSLISVTGGISDEILPADYASVADLLPLENGFSTFTTTIPDVWTPIDHLAIVWCKQLRHVLAKLLLEIVDSTTHSKTKPLHERIELSKNHLLSGFEDYANEHKPLRNPSRYSRSPDVTYESGVAVLEGRVHLNIDKINYGNVSDYNKINISLKENIDSWNFDMLTSVENPRVLFCKKVPVLGSQKNIRCVHADEDIVDIPKSSVSTFTPADSSWDEEGNKPYKMLSLPGNVLAQYDFIIIQKPSMEDISDSNFLYATLSDEHHKETNTATPLDILLSGQKMTLVSDSGINSKTWEFPNLWNSLISYQLSVTSDDITSDDQFEPFLRQATFEPFETKWHVNIRKMKQLGITMHNVAPFIPIDETQTRLLSFTLTAPPDTNVTLNIKIHWLLTLKLLFIRYRLAIASFLATFMSLVLFYQFYYFKSTSRFISFQMATSYIIRKFGLGFAIVLIILNPIVNNKLIERLLYFFDPVGLNDPFISETYSIYNNYYFLGIRDIFTDFIGLLFGLMTVGVFYLLGKIFDIIEYLIVFIASKSITHENKVTKTVDEKLFDKKRIFGCIILATGVMFYIPYQLAFVLMMLVQGITCIRAIIHQTRDGEKRYRAWNDIKNYNISILLLFIIVSIINGPIIIVFFHNVAIKWETTFNSHHNILAVLPVILFVVANSKFRVPIYHRSIDWSILSALILYIAFFSTIYGVRNLFWIHHLTNILSGWLFYGCLHV